MTAQLLEKLQTEVDRCPYHAFLRPEPVSAEVGTVVLGLPYRPELGVADGSDIFHGGVLAALVDITGHAVVALETGHVSPTIDLRVDYLRTASGPRLQATGRLVVVGASVARADVEVHDHAGRTVVSGRGTFSTR